MKKDAKALTVISVIFMAFIIGGLFISGCGNDNVIHITPTAADASGTITVSGSGSPIAGAAVTIGALSVVTDENGIFQITNVPAGSATVNVSKYGYVTHSENVMVVGGQTLALSFTLQPYYLVIGEERANTVSNLRIADNTITNTANLSAPRQMVKSPDGKKIYVINSDNTVSVLNSSDFSIIASIDVGTYLSDLAITDDGTEIYITDQASNNIYVIRTSDNTVTNTIDVGGASGQIIILPGKGRAYITRFDLLFQQIIGSLIGEQPATRDVLPFGHRYIDVIDLHTKAVVNTFSFGLDGIISDMVSTADGNTVYAAQGMLNKVFIIDTATDSVTGEIDYLPQHFFPNLALSPDGSKLYIKQYFKYLSTISIIDTATKTITTTFNTSGTGGGPVTVYPDGSHIFAVNYSSNTVDVIRTSDYTIVETINTGTGPSNLLLIP